MTRALPGRKLREFPYKDAHEKTSWSTAPGGLVSRDDLVRQSVSQSSSRSCVAHGFVLSIRRKSLMRIIGLKPRPGYTSGSRAPYSAVEGVKLPGLGFGSSGP